MSYVIDYNSKYDITSGRDFTKQLKKRWSIIPSGRMLQIKIQVELPTICVALFMSHNRYK